MFADVSHRARQCVRGFTRDVVALYERDSGWSTIRILLAFSYSKRGTAAERALLAGPEDKRTDQIYIVSRRIIRRPLKPASRVGLLVIEVVCFPTEIL